jgi:hypothetical protein
MNSSRFNDLYVTLYPECVSYTQNFYDFYMSVHLLGMLPRYNIWFSDTSIHGFVSLGSKQTDLEDEVFAFVEVDIL